MHESKTAYKFSKALSILSNKDSPNTFADTFRLNSLLTLRETVILSQLAQNFAFVINSIITRKFSILIYGSRAAVQFITSCSNKKKAMSLREKLPSCDGMFHHFQVITVRRHERTSSRSMPRPKTRAPRPPSPGIRWSIIRRANRMREKTIAASSSARRRNTKSWKYGHRFYSCTIIHDIGQCMKKMQRINCST